jgi:hypothetical protein
MSQTTGVDRHARDGQSGDGRGRAGRFGAATPGLRSERAGLGDLVAATAGRKRRVITPWRVTALVTALLVAGGSYALGRYVIAPKPPHTVQIAVTAIALPAGARLTAADIRVVTVQAASVPAGYLSPKAAADALGLVTKQALPTGTLVTTSMLSPGGALPGSSQALVGLDLKAGQLPAGGVAIGQKVLVVLLPVNSQGVALTPVALINTTVWDLQPPDASGDVAASVIVPAALATRLASYASRGEVSLVATAAPPTTAPPTKHHRNRKPAKRRSHS